MIKTVVLLKSILSITALTIYSSEVFADVSVDFQVGTGSYICELDLTTGVTDPPVCPSGWGFFTFGTSTPVCALQNVVATETLVGVDSCPIGPNDLTETEARNASRYSDLASFCSTADFGVNHSFNRAYPASTGLTVLSCTVLNTDPGVWEDTRLVDACNALCVKRVEQTNSVSGDTRIVEQMCVEGEGLCPVDDNDDSNNNNVISDNPNIIPDTAEENVAVATQSLCNGLLSFQGALNPQQIDLRERCRDLTLEENDDLQFQGIQNLSAEEFVSRTVVSKQQYLAQLSNLNSRLAAIRPSLLHSARDISLNQVPAKQYDNAQRRGGAAGDSQKTKLGVFFTGTRSDGETEASTRSHQFNYGSKSYTLGVDYALNQNSVAGVAIGYGLSKTEFGNNSGDLSSESLALSFYGAHTLGKGWSLDGVLGYGGSDYENTRNIRYVANNTLVDQLVNSDTSSAQWFMSLGVGKTIHSFIDWEISARINYLDLTIERFSESTNLNVLGSGLALEIDEQHLSSLSSDINLRLSKPFSIPYGVLVPSLGISWFHEFDDTQEALRVRFLNDPFSLGFDERFSTVFDIPLNDIDVNYGRLNLGTSLLLSNGWNFYINAGSYLGWEATSQTQYTLGVRKAL